MMYLPIYYCLDIQEAELFQTAIGFLLIQYNSFYSGQSIFDVLKYATKIGHTVLKHFCFEALSEKLENAIKVGKF